MKNKSQVDEQMKIRVPPHVHSWLKRQSEKQERSMNWVINKILAQAKEAESVQHEKQA